MTTRTATPARRARWVFLMNLALCIFVIAGWPGTTLLVLAFMPCPRSQFNSKGQCIPWSTVMSALGLTLVCISAIGLIFVITMICLRYSKWYLVGTETAGIKDLTSDGSDIEDQKYKVDH